MHEAPSFNSGAAATAAALGPFLLGLAVALALPESVRPFGAFPRPSALGSISASRPPPPSAAHGVRRLTYEASKVMGLPFYRKILVLAAIAVPIVVLGTLAYKLLDAKVGWHAALGSVYNALSEGKVNGEEPTSRFS